MKKLLLIINILLFFSCMKYETDSNCYEDKPIDGKLNVEVSINKYNYAIPITIYNGNYENKSVFFRDTLSKNKYSYSNIPANKSFSITAEYQINNNIVIVVNKFNIKTFKSDDGDCWELRNAYVNLKLK